MQLTLDMSLWPENTTFPQYYLNQLVLKKTYSGKPFSRYMLLEDLLWETYIVCKNSWFLTSLRNSFWRDS